MDGRVPTTDRAEIRPQRGPQEAFLSSPADIAIYGGAAGGGKTYGLLLEAARHTGNPDFGAVIFRRESTQVTNEGGLWDTAMGIYPLLGGRPLQSPKMLFRFRSGAKVSFGHLQYDANVLDWQGAQIPLIEFDELTHFTRYQFFYMLSRNRSTCGVRPYIRATCNPDSSSWVADLIAWWIDQDSGYPIPERSGKIRWFVRVDDVLLWANSAQELAEQHGVSVDQCKSMTFIAASVRDNRALLDRDPGYIANLEALSRVERERLLHGNWKISPASGMYFRRHEVSVIDSRPTDVKNLVRAWDLAATEPDENNDNPDWTVGALFGQRPNGKIVIAHLVRFRQKAAKVREAVKGTAEIDGKDVRISIPEDPGQAGKDQAQSYVTMLAGWIAYTRRATTDKLSRAEPFAAQWQAGNVEVVRGPWNEELFDELEAFPSTSAHDDIVDACSDAYAVLLRPVGIRGDGLKVPGM